MRKLLFLVCLLVLLASVSGFVGTTQKALNYVFISPPSDYVPDINGMDWNFGDVWVRNIDANSITATYMTDVNIIDMNVWNDANFQSIGVAKGAYLNWVNVTGNIYGTNSLITGISKIQGSGCSAGGANAFALGLDTTAGGAADFASGQDSVASGGWSTAMGFDTEATGLVSTAIGWSTTASGDASAAFGYDSRASGDRSIAFGGSDTWAKGLASVAMGGATVAVGPGSVAGGKGSTLNKFFAIGEGAIAFGYSDTNMVAGDEAADKGAIALGYNVKSLAEASVTLGKSLTNYRANSVLVQDLNVLGDLNVANFSVSGVSFNNGGIYATGDSNFGSVEADAYYSTGGITVEGAGTFGSLILPHDTADPFKIYQEGDNWIIDFEESDGDNMGLIFRAGAEEPLKIGLASGSYSGVAFGSSIASGSGSVAMGFASLASGSNSAAMGFSTTASGIGSAAFGSSTTASGISSAAMGEGTKAESYAGTAFGRYNVGGGTAGSWVATDPLFELGIGTSTSARADAFVVKKNGKAWFTSDVNVGGNLTATGDLNVDGTITLGTTTVNYNPNSVLVQDLNVDGNSFTNAIYGEMYVHTGDIPDTVPIPDTNVFHHVPGLSAGILNGVGFQDNNLVVQVSGIYKVDTTLSFAGGGNSVYDITVGVNHVEQSHCYSQRKIGSGGDVGNTGSNCLLSLTVGDRLTILIEDEENPAADAEVHNANLTIIRIGT